jgi:octaprenyl-diphosphate synthase
LIHTATLLHDDVIDDGTERRGAPTARRIWGNAVSVLSGDALLVSALTRTWTHCPQLLSGLLSTLRRLVAGEVVQLRGRSKLDLSESLYEQILSDKTASLFRFATECGAELAGADPRQRAALGAFGERLGIAFQLIDDVLDYTSLATGKTIGADLLEGKVTLPLVLAARENAEVLKGIERVRAGQADQVEVVRQLVLATGACEQVKQRALAETREALEQLQAVEPSPARLMLAQIAQQVANRGR